MPDYKYIGDELHIFAEAVNWKDYWFGVIRKHVRGDVLEAGAGIGGNTGLFAELNDVELTCLEPDPVLSEQLANLTVKSGWQKCRVKCGTTLDLPLTPAYDTILYLDVLEHIEDDAGELERASSLLRKNGCLVILAPALGMLYSPFDKAVGHFRRYDRDMLRKIIPADLEEIKNCYLDSAGLVASLGNMLLLRQSVPDPGQIRLWDRYFVRISRIVDPAICNCIGKSVVGVWKKA